MKRTKTKKMKWQFSESAIMEARKAKKKELRLCAFKVHSFISNKILKSEGAKLVNNNNETKKIHPATLKIQHQFLSKLDGFNQLN